ncbi:MAG: CPBP family intramembrane metalloprotease [candidate division KSB1 bacterium]|nr:CPBP family intramembrane metalloprotease [candidate division KSB1 bacterium]MDZ7273862.1 CPBP family intramembrane metalloprotease [candidate division KSB1 bacterium]MDZ7286018.1 CPBP family intramembrane metalloprotease [candidate division KSB1 bacterium]MDZ7299050.1 CPBP family intramembrane metalloprotease [candidate division KSB1 bacterium]MDZ7308816.1 CPBP family intramembrane metalloprotease [candidate division KSB1 bacterium]
MEQGQIYPNLAQAFGLLGMVILLLTLASIPISLLGDLLQIAVAAQPLVLALANTVAIGLTLLWGSRQAGAGFRELFPLQPVAASLWLPMMLTILGMNILLSECDNLLRLVLPVPNWLADLMRELFDPGKNVWATVLTLVIVAPVTEEFLFRGLILRGLLGNYGRCKAVLASALLFALIHLNPWQFFSAAVAGVVLGWWFVQTRSLVPCLFGHALHNALPVLVLSWLRWEIPGYTTELNRAVEFQPLWFDALGVVMAGAGIALLRSQFRKPAATGQSSR